MTNTFPGFRNEVVTTNIVHARIHQGLMFSSSVLDEGLANDANLDILIQISSPVSAHLRATGRVSGDAIFRIFEGTEVSDIGTPNPVINRNRFSDIVSEAQVFIAPTIADVGLELDAQFIPGGGPGPSSGGDSPFFEEFILRTNTNYLIRLNNISGQSMIANIQLDYYEPAQRVGVLTP